MDPHTLPRPNPYHQYLQYVWRNDTATHNGEAVNVFLWSIQPPSAENSRRSRALGADKRSFQDGIGISGAPILENQDGRYTGNAPSDVGGIAGNPLETRYRLITIGIRDCRW